MGTVSYLSVARARRMGLHRPAGRMALVNEIRQEPGAGLLASNAGRPLWQDIAATLVLCVFLGAALWLLWLKPARAESPRRQPDVPALLGELDRIEGGIVTHEISVARWRAQR